jgi:hypothetical protein
MAPRSRTCTELRWVSTCRLFRPKLDPKLDPVWSGGGGGDSGALLESAQRVIPDGADRIKLAATAASGAPTWQETERE